MGQVTIYLDKHTEHKLKQAASTEGVSQSEFLARLLRQTLDEGPQRSVVDLSRGRPGESNTEEVHPLLKRSAKRTSTG